MEMKVGDIIRLKKKHPCGYDEWEILRVGADYRIRCLSCGRQIMMPEKTIQKSMISKRNI